MGSEMCIRDRTSSYGRLTVFGTASSMMYVGESGAGVGMQVSAETSTSGLGRAIRTRVDVDGGGVSGAYEFRQNELRQAMWLADTSNTGPSLEMIKSRGSLASPSLFIAGDVVGGIDTYSYDGTTKTQAGGFYVQVEAVTNSSTFNTGALIYVRAAGALKTGPVSHTHIRAHETSLHLV